MTVLETPRCDLCRNRTELYSFYVKKILESKPGEQMTQDEMCAMIYRMLLLLSPGSTEMSLMWMGSFNMKVTRALVHEDYLKSFRTTEGVKHLKLRFLVPFVKEQQVWIRPVPEHPLLWRRALLF